LNQRGKTEGKNRNAECGRGKADGTVEYQKRCRNGKLEYGGKKCENFGPAIFLSFHLTYLYFNDFACISIYQSLSLR
jgi:hypothetical protein